MQFVSTPNKARTPIVQGDEIEIAGRMYKKYTALAKEYYQDFKADAIKDGKTYENLGELFLYTQIHGAARCCRVRKCILSDIL